MKQLVAGYWAGYWFGVQLCALQNRAWLAGNTSSRSTCCSGRQGKCFGISLAGSHQHSPFPGFSVWIPGAAWLHLCAEAPVLLKPFLARLGHGSAWCTQMQTQQQASSRQLRDFQCLQWPWHCQSCAAVPWERELPVAFGPSQRVMFPLPAHKCG